MKFPIFQKFRRIENVEFNPLISILTTIKQEDDKSEKKNNNNNKM